MTRLLVGMFDHLAQRNLPVIDSNIVSAIRIGADPGFITYLRPLTTVIGKRNQYAFGALETFRIIFHFISSQKIRNQS